MAPVDVKVCPRCLARYDAAAGFCQKDGARLMAEDPEEADPYIGQVLLDQFRIEELVGAGGMGAVYRAHQTTIDRDVAIKVLHADLVQNPDAVRRFKREAKVASALDHPNVVRVFLFGQLPDESLYLVMQFVKGRSLAAALKSEGPFDVGRALHIATQICDGVGEAHRHGVIHRDVKPENVHLLQQGDDPDFVKVLDFGIARFLAAEQTVATQSGLIFGTARYISPEAASGELTDARSDVYSIGVLTYQMLCGRAPFEGKTPVALLMQHINDPVPHLRDQPNGRHIPSAVADVVMRTLTKNPEGRPDDANALADSLRDVAAEVGVAPTRWARRALDGREHMGGTSRTLDPVRRPPRHRPPGSGISAPTTVLVAFLLGAAAVGGGAWVAVRVLDGAPAATAEEDQLVARARTALARGHLDSPPGDNVAELTALALERSPEHEGALGLRREAAQLLRGQAIDAVGRGHRDLARTLYGKAISFAPGDASLRRALADLDAVATSSVTYSGEVHVEPPRPPVGGMAMLIVELDHSLPDGVTPRFVLERDGQNTEVAPAHPGLSRRVWMARYTFSRPARYGVTFLADADGVPVRLQTEVRVGRGRGERTHAHGQAPATTQRVAERTRRPPPTARPTMAPDTSGIDWALPGSRPRPTTMRPQVRQDPLPVPTPVLAPTPAPPAPAADPDPLPAPPPPWTG